MNVKMPNLSPKKTTWSLSKSIVPKQINVVLMFDLQGTNA